MFNKVKVIGLQRSGTNYLDQLVKENFKVQVYSNPLQPFFKHAFPTEINLKVNKTGKYINTKHPVLCVVEEPKTLFIIVRKQFNHWYDSIIRKPIDFFKKNPFLSPESPKQAFEVHHILYYNKWEAMSNIFNNVTIIDYEDLLTDLTYILYFNFTLRGIKPKHSAYKDVTYVKLSKEFTQEDKMKYLE